MKWTDEATTEFVKLFMKHECLWHPLHPQFRVKRSWEKSFSEIAESFNNTFNISLNLIETRNRVKNLKKTYMQQVKIILEKSTPDYIHPPTLVWFEEMDKHMKPFLPYIHSTRLKKSIKGLALKQDYLPQSWNTKECLTKTNSFDTDPLIKNSDEEYTEEPTVEYLDTSLFSTKMGGKNKFSRKCKLSKDRNLELVNYGNGLDEFEVYGKYIASQLRQMHLQNAIRVQLRIQRLISEARLTELTDI